LFKKSALLIASSFAFFGLTASAVDYEYDVLGRLTKVDYGDGKVIEYAYDANGNRTTVSVDGETTNPQQNLNPTIVVVPSGSGFIIIHTE
jgi:YD repeat-containing protein